MRISIEDVRAIKCDMIKYVRIAGEYRFCPIEDKHTTLIDKGEKALSAGIIAIYKDCWEFRDQYSLTLNIGTDKHDEARLIMVLGKKYKED